MSKEEIAQQKITPDHLLSIIGISAADNIQGFNVGIPWKSRLVGQQVRSVFAYQKMLKEVRKDVNLFGPWALAAAWHSSMMDRYVTGPIKAHARMAVGSGRNPDIIADTNGWIYKNYSRLLYTFTGFFIKNGKFDREKALKICTSAKGQEYLENYMAEFAELESGYNNVGLTRLKAMKELVKCILVVVTETPFEHEKLPFAKYAPDGTLTTSFEDYLEENRNRLENLFAENAYDIKEYSEKTTYGKIGCSSYEVVEGSLNHRVTLRHYPPPKGVKPNGKVIYMASPLINKPDIFDLATGKSVVEGLIKDGYHMYLVDHGDPGWEETELGLDFYGKALPEFYLDIVKKRHPKMEIYIMAYCMGGTLILPYLARRAEELLAAGKPMDIKKIVLMASPMKFDDAESGHGPMRAVIRNNYDADLMKEFFGSVNIPQHVIEAGMNDIQPGVQYNVVVGFYGRAEKLDHIRDSAPFLYWLTHGTKFPVLAHRQWIEKFFLENQLYEGTYCLPSSNPNLDGKPVNMDILSEAGVCLFEYRGTRDVIAPPGSCVANEKWGKVGCGNIGFTSAALNRTIEKNVGHIFVVSRKHLGEFLEMVREFYNAKI